jgi:hypothetical protein
MSEHESALMWFSSEKQKIESELKNDNGKTINSDSVLDDYFEKKVDKKTEAVNKLLFG